jgi:hypothetical protein
MTANARTLRRHPRSRRLATLLATVVALEAKATDDCLELLDLLMVTELLGKAERESVKEKARQHPRLARASAKLATAVEVLLNTAESGELALDEVWELIDAVVSRGELRAAVAAIGELVPPDSDDEGVKRAQLATRIATVTGFLKTLTGEIEFGATADARAVLGEMQRMPELLRARKLTSADVDGSLIHGSWKRLVFAAPGLPDGAVDKNAYVFCVLTAFHRHLKRREIYANASTRWRDPRARLLAGDAWTSAKPAVLTALSLPAAPDELLAGHARTLDDAYHAVGARLAANTAIGLDSEGQLHIERLEVLEEPASLIELRRDVNALLPRVDLPEVILEVMSWEPGFVAAFIAASGGQTRLADLQVTIAACLTAHALNIGSSPIVKKGVPALERDRLGHVNQNYLGTETYAPANGWLIAAQPRPATSRRAPRCATSTQAPQPSPRSPGCLIRPGAATEAAAVARGRDPYRDFSFRCSSRPGPVSRHVPRSSGGCPAGRREDDRQGARRRCGRSRALRAARADASRARRGDPACLRLPRLLRAQRAG